MEKAGNAVLVALSVVLGVYLAEALVLGIELYRSHGRMAIADTPLAKVLELRASGIEAWPTVHPRSLFCRKPWDDVMGRCRERRAEERGLDLDGQRIVPLSGLSGVVTVYCREAEDWAIYRSDRHGFNNPDAVWDQVPAEMAVVGDSFVQGACVPAGSGLVDGVRKAFPASLNLGYGGNGPLAMLASIKEYAALVRPARVLWVFFGNDLRLDLPIELETPALARYLEPGYRQGLANLPRSALDAALGAWAEPALTATALGRNRPWPLLVREAGERLAGVPRLGGLRQFLASRFGWPAEDPGPDPSAVPGWERFQPDFQRILEDARDTVGGWGGRLHFVYLPDHHEVFRFLADRPKAARARRIHELVLRMAESLGIPVIDLYPPLIAREDPASLIAFSGTYWGHYTSEGYRLLVAAILKGIDAREDRAEQ